MRHLSSFFIASLFISFAVVFAGAQSKQDDYSAQFAKVTPSPLPQSPVISRVGSDRADAGLRARVKSLVEEKEYLDNTVYPPNRHKTREREFGLDGNLITERFYDYRGNPFFVVVFGYIDGKRVSNAGEPIHHSYDPPPMMLPPGNASPQPPKGDDRYTSIWEYKYDKSGRLVEELRYNNRGVADYRTTYEFENNIRKSQGCNIPCNYNSPSRIVTLDNQGLEIKQEYAGKNGLGEPEDVTSFKYLTFDSEGNWTKREATGALHNSRNETKPIHYIEYRTFTYY